MHTFKFGLPLTDVFGQFLDNTNDGEILHNKNVISILYMLKV
jgi:hypothetical protein